MLNNIDIVSKILYIMYMNTNIHEKPTPPYREKAAWLSFAAILAAFTPYFAITAASSPQNVQFPAGLHQLGLFFAATMLQVLILAVGHAVLRLSSPAEASAPPDERDRDIERSSITWAYYALISAMIIVGIVMPFRAHGWTVINAGLLGIVIAELVHYGGIAARYRRQA